MIKDADVRKILKDFRREIDLLDEDIIALFKRRIDIINRVAKVKSKYGITPRLGYRVDEVLNLNIQSAKRLGIDAELVEYIYTRVIDHAIGIEEEYQKTHKK